MANGRFRHYYWRIRSLVAEKNDIVRLEKYSSDDTADYANRLEFRLVFNDGSKIITKSALRGNDEVIEYDYYYCYRDANNVRVFSYDDRTHHPNLCTHPHHMHQGAEPESSEVRDQASPSDLESASFFTVFEKVCNTFFP